MKTTALIAASILFFSLNISGQPNKNQDQPSDSKIDSTIITVVVEDPLYGKIFEKYDLQSKKIIKPNFDLKKRNFSIESSTIKQSNDKLLADRFPGSDRFYAKRPYQIYPYEKSFFKKPDTTSKYYLIIKDPITNKIIN